jgi:hypothetical protein
MSTSEEPILGKASFLDLAWSGGCDPPELPRAGVQGISLTTDRRANERDDEFTTPQNSSARLTPLPQKALCRIKDFSEKTIFTPYFQSHQGLASYPPFRTTEKVRLCAL